MSIDIQAGSLRFATGSADGAVRVWSTSALFDPVIESRTDELAKRLRQPLFLGSGVHEGGVHCLRWSTSGKLFASGDNDGAVIVWELRSLSGGGGGLGIGGLGGSSFSMVQAEVWSPMRILRGHNAEVQDISWSPCDRLLATSSIDTKVLVWLIDKPQTSPTPTQTSSSSSSSSSSFIAGAKKSLHKRSGRGGKQDTSSSSSSAAVGSGFSRIVTSPLVSLEGHLSWAQGLAWDPLGRFLASAGNDKQVILWRVGFTGGTEDFLRSPAKEVTGSSSGVSSARSRRRRGNTSDGGKKGSQSSSRRRRGGSDSSFTKKRSRNDDDDDDDDEEEEDEDDEDDDEEEEVYSGDEATPGSRDSFAVRAAEGWVELRSSSFPYKHCTSESNVRRIDWSSDGTSIATSHAFLPEDIKSMSTEGSGKGKYTCPLLSRARWYASSSENNNNNYDSDRGGGSGRGGGGGGNRDGENERGERREFETSTIIPTAIHLCGHIRPVVAVRSSPLLSSSYGIHNKRVSYSCSAVGGMDGCVSIWSPLGRDPASFPLSERSSKDLHHRFKPTLVLSNLFSSIVTDLAWGSAPDAALLASCRVLSTTDKTVLSEETWQNVYAAAAPASTLPARCPFLLAVSLDGTAACILFGDSSPPTPTPSSTLMSSSDEGPLGIVASTSEVLSHLCHLYHVKQGDVVALMKGGASRIRLAQSLLRRKHRLVSSLLEGHRDFSVNDDEDEHHEKTKRLRDFEQEKNEEKVKSILKEMEWEDDAFALIDEAIDLELKYRDGLEGKIHVENEEIEEEEEEEEMMIGAVDIALFLLRRQTLYGIPENIPQLPLPTYTPDVPDRVL